MENKEYNISRKDLLTMLFHLEVIVPSLDRIGSCYQDISNEEYYRITSDFLDDWQVFRRLSQIRFILSKLLPYDEWEALFGEAPTWSYNNRKPPDSINLHPELDSKG